VLVAGSFNAGYAAPSSSSNFFGPQCGCCFFIAMMSDTTPRLVVFGCDRGRDERLTNSATPPDA
jgi:hypothetical protein